MESRRVNQVQGTTEDEPDRQRLLSTTLGAALLTIALGKGALSDTEISGLEERMMEGLSPAEGKALADYAESRIVAMNVIQRARTKVALNLAIFLSGINRINISYIDIEGSPSTFGENALSYIIFLEKIMDNLHSDLRNATVDIKEARLRAENMFNNANIMTGYIGELSISAREIKCLEDAGIKRVFEAYSYACSDRMIRGISKSGKNNIKKEIERFANRNHEKEY